MSKTMTGSTAARSSIGRRVLVVDDDPDIRENLRDILGDMGFEVDIAFDGPSALEVLARRPIDVALVDLRIPGMDGLSLIRHIRDLGSPVVPIVVTAYAGHATPEQYGDSGAWRVVSKPIEMPRLLKLFDEAMDRPLVLIVDDDRPLCSNLWDILRENGYRVSLVHSVQQAEAELSANDPRVIVIDIRLPDGDGVSVLRHVRSINPDARTIVVTGFPRELDGLIHEARREGADAVCLKPFDVHSLLALLEDLSATR
ncbi:MAG: response regulator [Isosphaeraceae bacterium]|nr:response regulator [Isosphaeraceae bacterium]